MNIAPEKSTTARAGWPRQIFNRTILVSTIVSVGIGGYFAWQKFNAHGGNLEQYQIVKVQRGDIEDLVTATGAIQPRDYVDVGAQVSGQMKKIHVEIGSVVKAGDLLAEIDSTVYLATVDARRAQLRNQQATLTDKQSQLTLAQLQHTRQKNLLAGEATTTELVQSAEAAVRSAKAQIDALQALIEQTESTLRADDANLNYAKIYAPMGGVVVSITARQGQTLNTNQQAPTILRIADLTTMTVQTQVSEADVSQLRPSMDVYFTTLGSRGRRWHSSLRKVEPTPVVTNNVVLYNALFDIPNTQRNLLPQMTAQVFFIVAAAKDVLVVPASAVSTQRGGDNRENKNRDAGQSGRQTDAAPATGMQSSNPQPRQSRRVAPDIVQTDDGISKQRPRRAQGETTGSATTIAPEVWAGVSSARQRGAREATVKVVTAEGKIEERKVQVGISNRIQVQILAGLLEGEQIIAGVKQQAMPRAQQRNALQQTQGGAQGMSGTGRAR